MQLYNSKYLTVETPPSVERALNVAKAAKKHLVIVTGDPLFKALADNDPTIHVEKPCPCGFFGSDAKRCACTVQQIEKHRAHWPEYPDALWVEGQIGTRGIKYPSLDDPSAMLLNHARKELSLTAAELVTIIETAEAIAKMSKTEKIAPEHIAEAISYQQKRS